MLGRSELTENVEGRRRLWQTPAIECNGLGARFSAEEDGKWRGGGGVLVGAKMEGNRAFNRRIEDGGSISGEA